MIESEIFPERKSKKGERDESSDHPNACFGAGCWRRGRRREFDWLFVLWMGARRDGCDEFGGIGGKGFEERVRKFGGGIVTVPGIFL